MDLRKIKKLIDLLEESNLAEIEIKEGEESVRLARTPRGTQVAAPPVMHAPAPMVHAPTPSMPQAPATEGARRRPGEGRAPGAGARPSRFDAPAAPAVVAGG